VALGGGAAARKAGATLVRVAGAAAMRDDAGAKKAGVAARKAGGVTMKAGAATKEPDTAMKKAGCAITKTAGATTTEPPCATTIGLAFYSSSDYTSTILSTEASAIDATKSGVS